MSLSRLQNFEERLERRKRLRSLLTYRLKDRNNPMEQYDTERFFCRFHMRKETVVFILDVIKADLVKPVKRGLQLPPMLQLLTVLRFYASGAFQIVVGDLCEISQPTTSKLITRVSRALAKHYKTFIKYPDHSEAAKFRSDFYKISSFPGVVGAIDGCHVKIDSPGGSTAELFRNRKGYFSINVQAVCDANLKFTNIVSRWYGSAHDSRMFENSVLYDQLESGIAPGILLGDSGYPCLPFVMTPFEGSNLNVSQMRYNRSQIRTRNCIERCFGIWKKRFPCLFHLRLKVKSCLIVIVATAILHNILRTKQDLFDDVNETSEEFPQHACANSSIQGRARRNAIVANHFDQRPEQ